ncbi:hypothetical protein ACFOZY_14285 [Chungangia koreensis]|uniref:DUF4233 domain-containing protein n=1 Tax=Chungangia koreensis TaxID=752657 RepID=A0ABV8XB19_9LACT
MRISTGMKWLTGLCEVVLGIPFIGASIIIGSGWSALGVMLILHAITLILSIRDMEGKGGPILGLVTSVVGLIPFVGMVLHWITSITLLISAYRETTH